MASFESVKRIGVWKEKRLKRESHTECNNAKANEEKAATKRTRWAKANTNRVNYDELYERNWPFFVCITIFTRRIQDMNISADTMIKTMHTKARISLASFALCAQFLIILMLWEMESPFHAHDIHCTRKSAQIYVDCIKKIQRNWVASSLWKEFSNAIRRANCWKKRDKQIRIQWR